MLFYRIFPAIAAGCAALDGYSESEGRQWLAAFLCIGQFVYANMENGC